MRCSKNSCATGVILRGAYGKPYGKFTGHLRDPSAPLICLRLRLGSLRETYGNPYGNLRNPSGLMICLFRFWNIRLASLAFALNSNVN